MTEEQPKKKKGFWHRSRIRRAIAAVLLRYGRAKVFQQRHPEFQAPNDSSFLQ